MKATLLLITAVVIVLGLSFGLTGCVQTTTTLPDGTVIVTKGIDKDALAAGTGLGHAVIDRNSGK